MDQPIFISTAELADQILSASQGLTSLQIIDSGMDHHEAFQAHHIPNAIFFNITEIRNPSSPLSIDFPTLTDFTSNMHRLNITNNKSLTVVYDQNGMVMSGRAWYMLKHFGINNVRILNGGFPKWLSENREVSSGVEQSSDRIECEFVEIDSFRALYQEVSEISKDVEAGRTNARVWDCRPPEVFGQGTVGPAVNVPLGMFLNEDKTIKSQEEVREIVRNRVGEGRIVVSCMKGIVACFGLALLEYCGHEDRKVYTGSLEEWRSIGAV